VKSIPSQFVKFLKYRRFAFRSLVCLAVASPFCSIAALAQVPAHNTAAAAKPAPASDELTARIVAAGTARDSGNPDAAAAANELLIATALREMAYLRSIEAAYPQAIEIYKTSLDFEDSTITRADLALAEAQGGRYDEAIELAERVRASDPNNLKADRVLASAYVQKGDYASAVEPFTRVATAQPSIENYYALANCLLQTGKPEDKARAQAIFDRMVKSAGESGSLHVLFGRAYRDANDMPSALREFQRAVAIDPHTPHAHYFLGLAELALNEWKPTPEAKAELQKEAENYPHDYLANYMLGFLASGERQYDVANKYLQKAAEIDPTAPEPFLYLGLNAYAQDDMKSAEEMLRKAVELTGNDEGRSNYQIRRAYVDLSRILTTSGRKDEAEVFIAKAHDLQNKTMAQSQQSIAAIAAEGATAGSSAAAVVPLSRQQENAAAPILKYTGDESDKLDPSTLAHSKLTPEQRAAADKREAALRAVLGLAYNDLATSEAIRHEYPRALSYYQQAERWDNTLPGLEKNLGQCAFRAGDFAEAARGLSLALQKQPDSTPIRAMLGMSYFGSNQFADAVKTFTPLGARGMRDSEIGYAWAASLAHTGDMAKATEVLTAFEAAPRGNDVLLLIGQLWTEIGNYSQAVATLQRALRADPSLPKAHFYAGLAYLRAQKWPDAAKEFQAELKLAPGDPDALYHLGFVDMEQARNDDAVELFREVVTAHPEYANAQYQLGKIMLDRGQVADAVNYLETAARLSPQTDYIHYQLQAAYRRQDRVAEADRELEIYKQIKARSREHAAEVARPN
jgi:tetratricopeptide (TPR) repeat protein